MGKLFFGLTRILDLLNGTASWETWIEWEITKLFSRSKKKYINTLKFYFLWNTWKEAYRLTYNHWNFLINKINIDINNKITSLTWKIIGKRWAQDYGKTKKPEKTWSILALEKSLDRKYAFDS